MANQKITQLNSITWSSVDANNDVIPIVDVNDTSMAPSGTTKKISAGQLISSLVPQTRTLTINGTTYDLSANRTWTISTGLTVGTTAIASGTVGRILFEGAGNVLQEDAALFWDNTNKRLGVGATPSTSARLDVRAQGALSTDIAFRVRNSADTSNIVEFKGDGSSVVSQISGGTARAAFWPYTLHGGDGFILSTTNTSTNGTATKAYMYMTETFVQFAGSNGVQSINFNVDNSHPGTARQWQIMSSNLNDGALYIGTGNNAGNNRRMFLTDSATLNIGRDSMGNIQSGTNQLRILSGTPPSSLAADTFALYSADRGGTAGKASPHFRCEDGTIIVLGDFSGFGTSTPQARLDVRAQGALSTDIAFRVRNSADSNNLFELQGTGFINVLNTINSNIPGGSGVLRNIIQDNGNNLIFTFNRPIDKCISFGYNNTLSNSSNDFMANFGSDLSTSGAKSTNIGYNNTITSSNNFVFGRNFNVTTGTNNILIGTRATSFRTIVGSNFIFLGNGGDPNNIDCSSALFTYFNNAENPNHILRRRGNIALVGEKYQIINDGTGALGVGNRMDINAENTLTIHNGTSPSINITDAFQQYSADITAGNAAPHFRTEAGDVIKLYKETTAVTAGTYASVGGSAVSSDDTFGGYSIGQVVQALKNLGILA